MRYEVLHSVFVHLSQLIWGLVQLSQASPKYVLSSLFFKKTLPFFWNVETKL